MNPRAIALAALSCLSTASFAALSPRLVRDINETPEDFGGAPLHLTKAGNQIFFRAYDPVHGFELWKTDGTEAGTVMVGDLRPGLESSFPDNLTAFGGRLFFSADHDGINGPSFWTSDGTAEGTARLEGFAGTNHADDLSEIQGSGNKLFFKVRASGRGGPGFLAWDGTTAPVELNGPASARTFYPGGKKLSFVPGTLLFAAGPDLWQSNGTAAGTVKLASLLPGSDGGLELLEIAGDDTLFLSRYLPGSGRRELWKYVRGSSQLQHVAGLMSGGMSLDSITETRVAGGRLFFRGATVTGDVELWVSNGTTQGTWQVEDIKAAGSSNPQALTAVGSLVYFLANGGTDTAEIWRTDGTAEGTSQVTALGSFENGGPRDLVELNGVLYFGLSELNQGVALWKTDGSAAGTTRLKIIKSIYSYSPRDFTKLGTALVFNGSGEGEMEELWTTDGSVEGTRVLKDISPGTGSAVGMLEPGFWLAVGKTLYFSANDGVHGEELWKTNGRARGTRLVADVIRGEISSQPENLVSLGDSLYFTTRNELGYRDQLWAIRPGKARARKLLGPLEEDGNHGQVVSVQPLRKKLLFTVELDGVTKLWSSNGTAKGTKPVSEPDLDFGMFTTLVTMGNHVYLPAASDDAGYGLWQVNRKNGAISLLKPMPGLELASLTAAGDTLFFKATDESGDIRLWKSDGSGAGTVPVTPANLWAGGSYTLDYFFPCGGKLYFMANDGNHGDELWCSDGTAEGTAMVKDIQPVGGQSHWAGPQDFAAAGDILYFAANDGVHGRELWRTDGTEEGTWMLADVNPGAAGSMAWGLAMVGQRLYFSAHSDAYGQELWTSDGSPGGTVLVEDLVPGSGSSDPVWPIAVGDKLYFGATTLEHGREMWVIDKADQP